MADLNHIAEVVGSNIEDPFVIFMGRVDDVIVAKTASTTGGAGLGVFDFADADWAGLFEDAQFEDGEKATDQQIIDTLAEADPLFAALMEEAH